jgi:hypothetical protein
MLEPLLGTFVPVAFDFGGALTFVAPTIGILVLPVFNINNFGGGFSFVAPL